MSKMRHFLIKRKPILYFKQNKMICLEILFLESTSPSLCHKCNTEVYQYEQELGAAATHRGCSDFWLPPLLLA